MSFKEKHPLLGKFYLEKRKEESDKIRQRYPDRIPIISEKAKGAQVPDIDKTKFLVPSDLTAHQFSYIIRKRLKLAKEQSLWLFVNGKFSLKGG